MSVKNIIDPTMTVTMYCVKCRTMVAVTGLERTVLKNDRHALRGQCPHCSTFVYKIVSKDEVFN